MGGLSSDRGGLGYPDIPEVQTSRGERLGGYSRGKDFACSVFFSLDRNDCDI